MVPYSPDGLSEQDQENLITNTHWSHSWHAKEKTTCSQVLFSKQMFQKSHPDTQRRRKCLSLGSIWRKYVFYLDNRHARDGRGHLSLGCLRSGIKNDGFSTKGSFQKLINRLILNIIFRLIFNIIFPITPLINSQLLFFEFAPEHIIHQDQDASNNTRQCSLSMFIGLLFVYGAFIGLWIPRNWFNYTVQNYPHAIMIWWNTMERIEKV